jgi:hypothetical protein
VHAEARRRNPDWGRIVPIRPLLDQERAVFSPEDVVALTFAFEDVLAVLRLVDRSDPAVTIVAKRTIELAKIGERDPILLRDAVLKSLRNDPGASGL